MKQRGRPPGTTKPKTYRVQVQIDAPMPRLSRIKRLEWLVGKLVGMIEQMQNKGK